MLILFISLVSIPYIFGICCIPLIAGKPLLIKISTPLIPNGIQSIQWSQREWLKAYGPIWCWGSFEPGCFAVWDDVETVGERDQQSEEPAFRTTCRAAEFLRPSALCVKLRARQTKSGIKKTNDPFPVMKHPETMVFRWGFTRIGTQRACLIFHSVCVYIYNIHLKLGGWDIPCYCKPSHWCYFMLF